MAKQTLCNWCGKVMSQEDEAGGISLHTSVGYGTIFDGANVDLDLCLCCTEEFIRLNTQKCVIDMIPVEYLSELLKSRYDVCWTLRQLDDCLKADRNCVNCPSEEALQEAIRAVEARAYKAE